MMVDTNYKLNRSHENADDSNLHIFECMGGKAEADLLFEFEKSSWPKGGRASKNDIKDRLSTFPQGISILFDQDPLDLIRKPMSQLTLSPKKMPKNISTFEQMRDLPVDLRGKTLWITNIGRRQGTQYQGKGYVTKHLKNRINWARSNGYDKIAAGLTLCGFNNYLSKYYPNLDSSGPKTIEAANKFTIENNNPAARAIIRASKDLGLSYKFDKPIPNYWQIDESSLGFGVVVTINLRG